MGNHIIDVRRKKALKDNLHWNCEKVDSYNKVWNFCISARGTAKSTKIAWKVWKNWIHKHCRTLILRRRPVDITPGYINSITLMINKFLPVHKRIQLYFNKGDLSQGQADLFLDKKHTILFARIQALSIPSERSKSNLIPDVSLIWFDEFIPNKTNQYLPDEVTNFLDVYGTYSRESRLTTKCWFTGNPYTIYNPFLVYHNIDLAKVVAGAFLIGKDYVLDFPIISEELKELILKQNPTYKEDDEYTQYALHGIAMHDTKYKIGKKPFNYKLVYVFRCGGNYLSCWKTQDYNVMKEKWFIEDSKKKPNTSKMIYAIDFDNLVQHTNLLTREIRQVMFMLKEAIARRQVSYSSVTSAVLIENLYKVL
jgi:hypothetical protein